MRFTFSFLALSAVTMMADPKFMVVVSAAAAPSRTLVDADPADTTIIHDGNGMTVPAYPLVFHYEMEDEWPTDPEILTQVEEAVVLAANEVYEADDLKFYGIFTKNIRVENITEEDDGTAPGNRALFRVKPRPIRLRGSYRSQTVIACKLCREDDDYGPRKLFGEEVSPEGDDATITAWQNRAIPGFSKAEKCFIYLDDEHDDAIQPLDSYESVMLLDDFYTDGFSIGPGE